MPSTGGDTGVLAGTRGWGAMGGCETSGGPWSPGRGMLNLGDGMRGTG